MACGDAAVRVFDRRKVSLSAPLREGKGSQAVLELAPLHLRLGGCTRWMQYGVQPQHGVQPQGALESRSFLGRVI